MTNPENGSGSAHAPAEEQLDRLRNRIGELLPIQETEALLAGIRSLLAGGKLLQYAERDELSQMLEAALEQFQAMAHGIHALRGLRADAAVDEASFSGQMKTSISGMREEILGANCPKPLEESLQRALVSLESSYTAMHNRERTRAQVHQDALNQLSASVHMLAEETKRKLEQMQRACLQRDVHPQTGLPGETALQIRLGRECLNALQTGAPLAVIAIMADQVDAVIREHEEAGESQLQCRLAESVKAGLRQSDFAAHDDTDCLLIVLPQADLQQAARAAEKLLRQIAAQPLQLGQVELPVTASCGLACYWEYDTPPVLGGRAKAAMARAHHAGGDRIASWEDG